MREWVREWVLIFSYNSPPPLWLALYLLLPKTRPDFESEAMRLLEEGRVAEADEAEELMDQRCYDWAVEDGHEARQKRGAPNKRVWHRSKSEAAAHEIDNALRGPEGLGPGLKKFQLPADWDSPQQLAECLSWPLLGVSCDQGNDLWTMLNWMDGPDARLNFFREPDTENHGVHNDWLGACWDCKLGGFLYSIVVCLNLNFLPYRDGRFGRMIFQCAQELRTLSSMRDKLFQVWLESVALEKGFAREDTWPIPVLEKKNQRQSDFPLYAHEHECE